MYALAATAIYRTCGSDVTCAFATPAIVAPATLDGTVATCPIVKSKIAADLPYGAIGHRRQIAGVPRTAADPVSGARTAGNDGAVEDRVEQGVDHVPHTRDRSHRQPRSSALVSGQVEVGQSGGVADAELAARALGESAAVDADHAGRMGPRPDVDPRPRLQVPLQLAVELE